MSDQYQIRVAMPVDASGNTAFLDIDAVDSNDPSTACIKTAAKPGENQSDWWR